MSTTDHQPEIVEAYSLPGQPRRPAQPATPEADMPMAMRAIVEAWNQHVPRHHVRRINQPRFEDLRCLLWRFRSSEIILAIEWYGRQTWQRQRGAWKTFDAWIRESNVTRWVEDLADHREREALAADARRLKAQAAADAEPPVPPADPGVMETAWADLPPPQRHHWLTAAKRSLGSVRTTDRAVELRAMKLWWARR